MKLDVVLATLGLNSSQGADRRHLKAKTQQWAKAVHGPKLNYILACELWELRFTLPQLPRLRNTSLKHFTS